jgi:3-carboxy-cis,cis-muconate cycloisomerase
MTLLDPLFGWKPIDEIFADTARLQRMLDFEAALARAEARAGVIPTDAANSISNHCRAQLFDLTALAHAAVDAGNLAIPMVRQLTELVTKDNKDAARYVHWGATSQDAIDTGLVLQVRDALRLITAELDRLCATLAQLAARHRNTPLAARTWLQQAIPTVFGLKATGYLDALLRHRARLRDLEARALVLQFGGAAGTLASFHDRGLDVAAALAQELKLPLPDVPWHAHRDRIAEVATTLALLTGTLGKIARDVSLQMQTEIAELAEPAAQGRGGSSTMPQKRNPVACAAILAAGERVPALAATLLAALTQEHERGLGNWHAEWETLPELVRLTAGALHRAAETIAGLEVDAPRMRQNLEITHGLIFAEAVAMALSPHLGKRAAHQLLEKASHQAIAEKKHLRDILAADPEINSRLSAPELNQLFDPANYTGMSSQFIDRVLAAHKKSESKS